MNILISLFHTHIFLKISLQPVVKQQLIISTRILGAVISNILPNWYSYRYDDTADPINHISDGGGDMYDGGNKVCFVYLIESL